MGTWEFVVAYLVAFVLIQLVVYRYLRGRGGDAVSLASQPNADRGARGDQPDHGERADRLERLPADEVQPRAAADAHQQRTERRCPACGTVNDSEGPYTFCRNCVTRLPG